MSESIYAVKSDGSLLSQHYSLRGKWGGEPMMEGEGIEWGEGSTEEEVGVVIVFESSFMTIDRK